MIRINDKMQDTLVLVSALLWVFLVVASWCGGTRLSYWGLIAGCLLTSVYFVLGATVKGRLGLGVPLLYPILLMLFLWVVAFSIVSGTQGQASATWILGLHPAQFWSIVLYWIGGGLTSLLGYALYFDKYLLPDEVWQDFLREVEKTRCPPRDSHD